MLLTLYIENVAVIDKTSIEFKPGLNVLTGETGAGKSIIIDAINALDEDYILLCFNNSVQPFICRNVDKNDGLYLILPVRTSNIA